MNTQDMHQMLNERYQTLRNSETGHVQTKRKNSLPLRWRKFQRDHRARKHGVKTCGFAGMTFEANAKGLNKDIAEFLAAEFRNLGIECRAYCNDAPPSPQDRGKGDYVLELIIPWKNEPTTFHIKKDLDRCADSEIVACLLFLEGADDYRTIAEDARWEGRSASPDRVNPAIEQALDLCRTGNPSDDMKPLKRPVRNSRKHLDDALAELAKTKSEFAPSDIMAMCYSPIMIAPGKRELVCEQCGAHFKVSNAFGALKIDDYEDRVNKIRTRGYNAKIDVFCPECAMLLDKPSSYEFVIEHSDGSEARTPLQSDLSSREDSSCIDDSTLNAILEFVDGAENYNDIDRASSYASYGVSRFNAPEEYEAELVRVLGLGTKW